MIAMAAFDGADQSVAVDSWHAQIGDPTIADSILDRLVHTPIASRWMRVDTQEKEGSGRGVDPSRS